MDSKRYGSYGQLPQVVKQQQGEADDVVGRLTQQNSSLRKKLKLLNYRLDDQLEKAAKLRFKTPRIQGKSVDNSSNQLKNAYKMIQRLQKSIKHYESNEGYNSSIAKIIDLEDVIKKKDREIQQLKLQIKTIKSENKTHQKHIQDLNEGTKKINNPAEDRQQIHRLKQKIKKLVAENDTLTKQNRQKHQKMVNLDIKARQLQRQLQQERPVPQNIQGENEIRAKYKELVERFSKQSYTLIKYREKISQQGEQIKTLKQAILIREKSEANNQNTYQFRQSTERARTDKPQSGVVAHVPSEYLPKRMRNQRGVYMS